MVAGKDQQQKKPEKEVSIAESPHHPRRSLSLSHPQIEEEGNKQNALCQPNQPYAAIPAPWTHGTPPQESNDVCYHESIWGGHPVPTYFSGGKGPEL